MDYREATPDDVTAIAELHADSWRRHYRGAYRDSYLDGDVVTERTAEWLRRFTESTVDSHTAVAEHDGIVAGFAHTMFDTDPEWGALLDNLHVRHDFQRRGIGERLLTESGRAVLRSRPESGLYLWVLEQNTNAQAFYKARGAVSVERKLLGPLPGGGHTPAFRYVWPDVTELAR